MSTIRKSRSETVVKRTALVTAAVAAIVFAAGMTVSAIHAQPKPDAAPSAAPAAAAPADHAQHTESTLKTTGPTPIKKAVAVVSSSGGSNVKGTVTFAQEEGGVRVVAHIEGLSPGKHGFHVHEFGDCSDPKAENAGGHFNPSSEPHAAPTDKVRHSGDLGNIEADDKGVAHLEWLDPVMKLNGPGNILGRGVIVHANADDLKTQPTGNAGARLGCGVIGVAKP